MQLTTRIHRTLKVGWASAALWSMYKIPSYARQLRGLPPRTEKELAPTHDRAATRILALALDMRGVMIKMCQAVATRSDVFPKEFVERLKNEMG